VLASVQSRHGGGAVSPVEGADADGFHVPQGKQIAVVTLRTG
jgi:hypothetical protein